jgi:hypothetical protein
MTAHSPVGLEPSKYQVQKVTEAMGSFANNDIAHVDLTGADHESFSYGLNKSLLNFMHGLHINEPLQKWFDFKIPKTLVSPEYLANALNETDASSAKTHAKILWIGKFRNTEFFVQSKKGNSREMASLSFEGRKESMQIKVPRKQGEWLASMLPELSLENKKIYSRQEVKENYEAAGLEDFELFWDNKPITGLDKMGLLQL